MIQLYTNNQQDINKNGIILNPINGKVHNILNGENELEMEVVLDKDGLYKYINRGCIITAPTPDFIEPQQYRIYNTIKNMNDNTMTVYARHIFFDLNKKIIFNKNVQGKGQEVLSKILEDTKFTGHSESQIDDIRQYKMRSIINVINGSDEDSFISLWGGEIEPNNYNLNIPLKRGTDRGIRVSFGYNLEDVQEELNADEIVTRIYPYSGDIVLSSNTPYVDSPLIAKYSEVYEQAIEMNDIKVKEKDDNGKLTGEGFNTRAEAEAEMIKRCKKLFDEGADKIKANYKVKMQDLSKTLEYKKLGYDILEKICLGDTIHCYNKNINIEVSARCISYTWDIVNEEFIEIELGQFISNYIDNNLSDLDNLYRKIVLEKQYILLRVDSLDNNLHTQIKLTEEAIKAEAEDTKKGLLSTIELTANGLKEDYTDKTNDLHTEIKKTAGEVKLKVSEEEMWAAIQAKPEEIAATIHNGTDKSVTLNNNGLTVINGNFQLEDSKGHRSLWCEDDGTIHCRSVSTDSLRVYDTDKESLFYKTFVDMKEFYTKKVSCEKLFVESERGGKKHIYDYIVDVLKDKDLI